MRRSKSPSPFRTIGSTREVGDGQDRRMIGLVRRHERGGVTGMAAVIRAIEPRTQGIQEAVSSGTADERNSVSIVGHYRRAEEGG